VPLCDVIQERSGGSPFFTEEVLQSLIESGSLVDTRGAYRFVGNPEDLIVPATVQAVLAARIDRLTEQEKQVLQTASVVGKTFGDSELASVVDLPAEEVADALRTLIDAELIYEYALYPEREYSFKHPLTQEVAYQTQLSERRAETHRAVAQSLAALPRELSDERSALIAHHWYEAGDKLESARWHRRAAQWTTGRAPEEAVGHWQRLRELVAELPESERTRRWGAIACSQLLNRAWRHRVLGIDETNALFEEGTDFAKKNDDAILLALVKFAYGTALGTAGEVQDWVRYSEEALDLAEDTGIDVLQAAILTGVSGALDFCGRYERAIESAERGIALTKEDPSLGEEILFFSPYLMLTALRGAYLAVTGRLPEAAEALDHAERIARERGDLVCQCTSRCQQVGLAYFSGERSGAVAQGRAATEVAERVGVTTQITAHGWLGLAHLLAEDWSQAVAALERCNALSQENPGYRMWEPVWTSHLGIAYAHCGNPAARETAERAVRLHRDQGMTGYETHAQLSLARVLLFGGDAEDHPTIESALARAAECVVESGARAYVPMIAEERANLARAKGDEAAAEKGSQEALRLYEEIHATGHVARLRETLNG
jgi:adenylate cyclase